MADQDETNEDTGPSTDEFTALQRELAFTKAGIDTDTPLGKMFSKAYEGELTADAVRKAAEDIPGLLSSPEPESAPEPDASAESDAQSITDAVADLSTGAAAAAAAAESQGSASERALAAFNEERAKGKTQSGAAAAFVGTMMTSAANGDETAIFDRDRWLAEQGL